MSKVPDGLKCEITPEQAYWPYAVPAIPDGHEFLRFSEDASGGTMLLRPDDAQQGNGRIVAPRIIARPCEATPTKPRRWTVEENLAGMYTGPHGKLTLTTGPHGNGPHGKLTLTLNGATAQVFVGNIREVKPITREQINEASHRAYAKLRANDPSHQYTVLVMRELGIEVED